MGRILPPVPSPLMPRCLIVDDEPAIGRALSLALARDGWACVHAASAEQAQACLRDQPFDAMIVDLRLNDMRGDVFLHVACALQPALAGATLFMTGDISPKADALLEATRCPAMHKPFDLFDVTAQMRRFLPRRDTGSSAGTG